ncbi:MAG: hypothetical protein ACKOUM_09520, partial [Sphingopyxis sp.]
MAAFFMMMRPARPLRVHQPHAHQPHATRARALALALPLAALLATTTAAPGAAHTASPPAPRPAPATIDASQRPAILPIAIGDDATYGCVDDGRVCLSLIT